MRDSRKQWETTTLGQHVDVQTGYPFKSQRYTDDPSGVRLLRGDNIIQGRLRWNGVKRWRSADSEDYAAYFLAPGDVVIAMDRPWIEAGLKYACIGDRDLPCLLVQRVARLRGANGLRTGFLRYLIAHQAFTDYVKGVWTGVAVPHISETQIRAFRIALPPIPVQEQIEKMLSAYDALIENNTRRIAILEEMARLVYREWFVNFRFPGHEKVGVVPSKLGHIPCGWSLGTVSDLIDIQREGIMPSSYPDERFLHFSIPAFDETQLPRSEAGSEILSNKYLVQRSSILISKLNPRIKRLWYAFIEGPTRAIASTEFLVLRAKAEGTESFVYELLQSRDFQDRFVGLALGTSTSHQRVKPSDFEGIELLIPHESVVREFCQIVTPMIQAIDIARRSIANVRQTRDFLLPRLISGEINVEQVRTETASQRS